MRAGDSEIGDDIPGEPMRMCVCLVIKLASFIRRSDGEV